MNKKGGHIFFLSYVIGITLKEGVVLRAAGDRPYSHLYKHTTHITHYTQNPQHLLSSQREV